MNVHRRPRSRARVVAASLVAAVLAASVSVLTAPAAAADNTTISTDNLRTGWDRNEPGLSPSSVSAQDFGRLFSTPVDGQVYAQPLSVAGNVVVATENNNIYGLNPQTGGVNWSRSVGAPWPASTIGCGDLVPNIGITSTPVYDPATKALFFTAKVNDGASAKTPHWYLHSIDPSTGVERAGWPVVIQGTPTNHPGFPFNPETAMQRPGLLLLDGVVYAGFASHCDYGPYVGYVVGFTTATPGISTLWSTETGTGGAEAGIWQSGGGLVSDGPGRIILTTGNGNSPAPAPGNQPPGDLAESVVRLAVNTDGSLTAKDFYSPANNAKLDQDDADLGSGGPMAVPDGFGTAAHPHLLVQIGKDGRLLLLDRDNLGGSAQGPGGTDAYVSVAGRYQGVWGHPAFWGGADGGYVYTVENGTVLRASKLSVDSNGVPILVSTGTSTETFGFGSGSPVITSSGTAAGSALVWVEKTTGSSGTGSSLLAYNAVPQNGVMNLVYSAAIGTAAKFATPLTDNGRVYVGTRDGHVLGFGRPAASALTAAPVDFGAVPVGTKSSKTLTVTATRAVTVNSVTVAAPFTATLPGGPVTLAAGATLTVPVTFTPTTTGASSATAIFGTDGGGIGFDLTGSGTRAGLAANPATLDFGTVPTNAARELSVNISNTGTTTATVTSTVAPGAPFTAALPADGTTIPAGGSVAIGVTYSPKAAGTTSSSLTVVGSTGSVTVAITGVAVSGSSRLTLAPNPVTFPTTLLGTTSVAAFKVSNTGNIALTITKAAPPVGVFNTTTPISEGQQLVAGGEITQDMTFTPAVPGGVSATYLITGDDGQGAQNERMTGVAGTVDNFIGAASGRCLDDANGSTANRNPVWLWDCNGSASQAWTSGPNSSLRAYGKCLSVLDGATAAGSAIDLYTCDGTTAQQWQVTATGTIRNVKSARCITPANGGAAKGTALQLGNCTTSATQVFAQPHRTGPVVGKASAKCLDVANAATADGTPVQLYTCNGTAAQSWAIAAGGNVKALGKCLTVQNAATAAGTAVQLTTCASGPAQQWQLQASGALRNPNSGRCLAPAADAAGNNTRMQILDCSAAAARLWVLS